MQKRKSNPSTACFEALEGRLLLSGSSTPSAAPAGSSKLTGTVIGIAGSYGNKGNTIANVFDGHISTFFDAPANVSQGWAGLGLRAEFTITQIQFVPRDGFGSRMVGGIFQGSNSPNFSSGVTNLYTVTTVPATNVYTVVGIKTPGSFEYVRYLAPLYAAGNVAEVEFDGFQAAVVTIPPAPTVPAAPVVAAIASSTKVVLHWSESPTSAVDSFVVERQGPDDADYVVVETLDRAATTYTDLNVQPSTRYSYQVYATNSVGSSDLSAPVTVTTLNPTVPPPVSNPWTDINIGPVGKTGSASMSSDGTLTVTGSGADIGTSTDAFNFDYQTMVGNGTLITQVDTETNTNSLAKSGIMIRETNNVDSRFVLLALTPANTVMMLGRSLSHNNPSFTKSVYAKASIWLKLTRSGSTFTGYVSTDGLSWSTVGTLSITMVNNVVAGLAVTSHDTTKVCSATFTAASLTTTGDDASAWTDGATAPMDRWESETFTYNGRLYVFGGFIDRNLDATNECDVYDPATNSWSFLTRVPAGALTHASVAVVGSLAYFVGGDLGTFTYGKTKTSTSEVLTYDLSTGIWGSTTSLPVAESCGGLAAINNHLYYYGGLNANDTADLTNTWALDLSNTKAGWIAKAPMLDGRNHIGSATIGGYAFAVGGSHLYNETKGNDAAVDEYNPATNKWTAVASLPMVWASNETTTLVANNKIVIVGGQTNGGYDGIYLSQIEEYDPASNKWSSPGNLPEANEGESAAYINGSLIVADGTVDNLGGWSQDQTWIDSEMDL